ncbi:hypothetical protein [Achromobacter phage maay_LB1]|nr:hypothetical protein [Achromobacter phage maay_LB1]WNO49330.1 hypothetical protein [Achromobacter phage kwar_LB4]
MNQADIEDLKTVRDYICNNIECSDEMQRLVSQIELRIMELEESDES